MATQVGAILLEARRSSHLTQAELARRSGVARSAISLYETGLREPGAEVFLQILAASGMRVAVERFTDEQIRRGKILSDLLECAGDRPSQWPGDDVAFPAAIWEWR